MGMHFWGRRKASMVLLGHRSGKLCPFVPSKWNLSAVSVVLGCWQTASDWEVLQWNSSGCDWWRQLVGSTKSCHIVKPTYLFQQNWNWRHLVTGSFLHRWLNWSLNFLNVSLMSILPLPQRKNLYSSFNNQMQRFVWSKKVSAENRFALFSSL